jgi:cellulose synthase operon protein C
VDYVQTTAPKVRYLYIADMPAGRPLYWNKSRVPPGITYAQEDTQDGRSLYRWSASHVSKLVPEPAMPGWAEVASTLHVSTYKTWEDVGRYYWGLVRDQLTPNDELRKTVDRALTGVDRKDELAVVRAVYHFVVTNTRYVALEFGIHGYKPYRVDRVLARKFGDCKDKASLIHAMLKVAGVESRLVLLRMRHLGMLGEEPASLAAFNHAIAYVPKLNLFLDGTAEFHGTAELPPSDRAASVLVVEPDGGSRFLTIPEASPQDDLTTLAMAVELRRDGSAELKGDTTIGGMRAGDYRRTYQSAATRKATFEQSWAQVYPGLTVKEVTLSDPSKLEQALNLKYRMTVPRFAEALPDGLRFHPFGSGRAFAQTFAPLSERRYDLVMSSAWENRMSYRYTLPEGYALGELPPAISEETPFGRMRLSCKQEGSTLTCEGETAITVARVKAGDYAAFRAFLTRMDQAFARKVIVGKTADQTARR